MANQFQNVRGMPDILPTEQAKYAYITEQFQKLASDAGYQPIQTPYLEDAEVFVRGVGGETDAVKKEMYELTDRSDNRLALRPEPTAGIVRAYIQHGMASLPQPVRLQSIATSFRYERPQAGRLRQFQAADIEVLGDASPSIDAQIISLALRFYRVLGLTGVVVKINSLGDLDDRKKYLAALVEFLQSHRDELAEIDRERLERSPLRVLDTKDPQSRKVVANAPQIQDYLSPESLQHFNDVKNYLSEMKVAFEVDPYLVRGLDYYTHTVFEFYGARAGAQSAIGGGGRYNGLAEQLGGKPTPAAGFGIGLERVLLELEAEGIELPVQTSPQIYVASLGEDARVEAFTLIERLLNGGISTVGAVDRYGLSSQLERAAKSNAAYALIIGQKEVQDGAVIVRNMKTGEQDSVALKTIVRDLQNRFKIA